MIRIYMKIATKMNSNRAFKSLITIMLTGIIWMILFGSCVVEYKSRLYKPFKEVLNQDGIYLESTYIQHIHNGENFFVTDSNELVDFFPGIEDVYGCYQLAKTKVNNKIVSAWAYDDGLISQYTPELMEGTWLSDNIDCDDDILEAVIYCPDGTIHAGDIITMSESIQGLSAQVKIIGVLSNEAKVYGNDMKNKTDPTVQALYISPENMITNGPFALNINPVTLNPDSKIEINVLFFRNRELTANYKFVNRYDEEPRFSRVMCGFTIITFREGISESEANEVTEELFGISDISTSAKLIEKKNLSIDYIWKELNVLLPLGVCMFVLMIIAMISLIILNFVANLRNYAVFFTCGMKWKQCISICTFQCVLLHMVSTVIFVITYMIVLKTNLFEMKWFAINNVFIIILVIMFMLDILLSLIMPVLIVNKRKPKEILYNT